MQYEYRGERPGRFRGRWRVLWLLLLGLAVALLLALLVLLAVAYARQSERVEDLEAQNASILDDHHAIGELFAKQSERFDEEARRLESAVQSAYGSGFRAGREAASLPAGLRPLGGHAAGGFLVPRNVPEAAGGGARVEKGLNGYTVRWRRVGVFANRLEPLTNWTRQALGQRSRIQVGPYRVHRVLGPSGVIYAWRKDGVTYAAIAVPTLEPVLRSIVGSMR